MPVIGNLAVAVTANTIGLRKGLGGATSLVSGFGSKLAGLSGIAAPLGAAIAGVTAAVKGVMEVGQAFGDIDRIAKSADSFGITTQEMVGLEHAAELSGVSVETLGKAMQKATREGTSLEAIADKMAAIEDPAARAQLAFKALGRQGQDLIPLLSEGGDAIREMMQEGSMLAGFSREDAKKIEEANDAISRMKLAFTGVARDIAISLAPIVEKVAIGVKNLGIGMRAAFTKITPIIEQVGNVLMSAWDVVWTATNTVFGGIFSTVQTTFAEIADAILNGLIVAEFGFNNLGRVATFTWETIKLGAFKFGEDFKFLFTDVLPSAIHGFANTAVKTMAALWDFIESGGMGDIESILKPLEEGFIDTIANLPDRAMTTFEQKMALKLAKMEGALTGDLAEFMTSRRQDLVGDERSTANDPLSFSGIAGGSAGARTNEGPAGLVRGSSEAFSAILAAQRKQTVNPQIDIAKNTKESLSEQKRQTTELRKLTKLQPVELVPGTV